MINKKRHKIAVRGKIENAGIKSISDYLKSNFKNAKLLAMLEEMMPIQMTSPDTMFELDRVENEKQKHTDPIRQALQDMPKGLKDIKKEEFILKYLDYREEILGIEDKKTEKLEELDEFLAKWDEEEQFTESENKIKQNQLKSEIKKVKDNIVPFRRQDLEKRDRMVR